MKHHDSTYHCVQDLTLAQQLARAYLVAAPEQKLLLARRLVYAVLGGSGKGRHYDPVIPEVDNVSVLVPWDEPVFLIRAEHEMGIEAVKTWLAEAKAQNVDPRLLRLVEKQIQEMTNWPVRKLPEFHPPVETTPQY